MTFSFFFLFIENEILIMKQQPVNQSISGHIKIY